MDLGDNLPEELRDAYSERKLGLGTVLKLFDDRSKPPKEKRFIVVGATNDSISLALVYINSSINTKFNYSIELQALHIPFKKEGRKYIEWDSFVDCSKLYPIERSKVKEIIKNKPKCVIGHLAEEDYNLIKDTIIGSKTIKGKDKKKYGFYS